MSVRIVTLNVWCPTYGKDRSARMPLIAQKCRELGAEIVCLQEMYLIQNREEMIENMKPFYGFQHYFSNGLMGSGLLTFSQYPIIDALFLPFRLSGKPERLKHADYYVAKGVGLTCIQTPEGVLDVYNTHTHAQYEPQDDNEYAVFNHSNLYEIARFINTNSPKNGLVLCGDYNTTPTQLGYLLITQLAQLTDTYETLYPNTPGITFDSRNPYVSEPDQRLDYVMVKNGVSASEVKIVFDDNPISFEAMAYSDHYGLLADLHLNTDAPILAATDTQKLLQKLHDELQRELKLTEIQRTGHVENMVFSLAGLVDVYFSVRFFRKHLPVLVQLITMIGLLFTLTFGGWHLLNATVNLRARRYTLEGLIQEIQHQLRASKNKNIRSKSSNL
jgi:sphingomyelin phosphodiesterase 2